MSLTTAPAVWPEPDPRGPVRTVAPSAEAAPGRVEVKEFAFDPATIPAHPGAASWMWLKNEKHPNVPPAAALFRKEIELETAPLLARVWFSADAHARLYVNGQLMARGPDDGGQDYLGQQTGKAFVNFCDLTPFFRAGTNVLALEVFSADAMAGHYNTTGQGGFLLEAALQLPGDKPLHLQGDTSWRGVSGDCWEFADERGEHVLRFNGVAELPCWRLPGFDDSAWPHCVPESTMRPELVKSEIPPRLEATYPAQDIIRATRSAQVDGHKINFSGEGSAAVRFDRVLSGFIGFKVRAGAGAKLLIEPNEPNEPGHHRLASAILREGEQTFELPFYDSFSVINLCASAPLEVLDVRVNFVAQPVSYQGAFACSDAHLTRLWEVCRWQTQICQQTHHLDSPHHQEPISDPGDYLIIALNNYNAFGSPHLARQDLRKYAWLLRATNYRPFHTSYALLWLQMLLQYEAYTGDGALLKELTPEVHALLDQFTSYLGSNGIVSEAPDYMFMGWVETGGFEAHHPPAVIGQGYMTAFFYRALADGIHVANLDGDSARTAKYQTLRREIAQAYHRELWDENKGLYRDGKPFVTKVKPGQWLPEDEDIQTHSAQNNALAVLYDLAPKERQAQIMRSLMTGDLNCQPYFMHFVFDALTHVEAFDDFATAQMRRWHIEENTQSVREMWGQGDFSHAWQCTPLFQMSARILGVTPLTPGFKTIAIRPRPCNLAWAKGAVPTPHGPIEVSWQRGDRQFQLEVKVPEGSSAQIEVPLLGQNATLQVDGQRMDVETHRTSVTVLVSSGAHVVLLRWS